MLSPADFETRPTLPRAKLATAPPATLIAPAKTAIASVAPMLKTPDRTKTSWFGRSFGVNARAPEKIIAAAPRSNIRSIVYTATCELSDSPTRRATRYGRVKSANRPNNATAVNPINCDPSKEATETFFAGERNTAQRTPRTQYVA